MFNHLNYLGTKQMKIQAEQKLEIKPVICQYCRIEVNEY